MTTDQGKAMRFCPRCATPLAEAEVDGKRLPKCQSPSCTFVAYRDPKVAVGVVTGENGKVLLGQRNHEPGMGLWTFPSGFVDAGEVVEEAAVREVKEETNLDVRIEDLLGVFSESGSPVVFIVYAGVIIGGSPEVGPETTEVGFFSYEELPPLAFQRDVEIIQLWLKHNKSNVGR
ncbi:MAG: NUDIX domain-containing protein [Dehalococcoidia bacterium]|nr:NUDIX domain-containing protein [Dehalococcoidia bacterium]